MTPILQELIPETVVNGIGLWDWMAAADSLPDNPVEAILLERSYNTLVVHTEIRDRTSPLLTQLLNAIRSGEYTARYRVVRKG